GIRDPLVTGVQTCALPISSVIETTVPIVTCPAVAMAWALACAAVTAEARASFMAFAGSDNSKEMPLTSVAPLAVAASTMSPVLRSEERRVGEGWMIGGCSY